ncbi:helix-turn-helix transcriptional regulator [Nocardiopsis tropica]
MVDDLSLSRFADDLRDRRLAARLSQLELGHLAGYSRQMVGEVERQHQRPSREFAEKMDTALEAGGKLLALFPRRSGHQRYLDGYLDLERRALAIDQFHAQIVPALLQHPDYARADLAVTVPPQPEAVLDQWLRTRMDRQDVFREIHPRPLAAQFVIDEGALRRVCGGPAVMAAQYEYILDRMSNPFVTVQVLPFEAGPHPVQHGACTILTMTPLDSVLYVETIAGSQSMSDPETVAQAARRFSALRACALSAPQSERFIRKLLEGQT